MSERIKVDMGRSSINSVEVEFPANSHRVKETKEEPRKIEKVIKGKALQRKKSLYKRFVETFIGEDVNSVTSYILHDVLIPAAKSTLSDMVQGGIEMLLFGERRGSRTTRDKGRSFVSYNNYSSPTGARRDERREPTQRNRSMHNFDDIVLVTRGEAEEVLSHLVDLITDYGEASVADLYDLVGLTEEFTDRKYGWTNLRSASVSRAREGYLLNLPKPILLD